MNNLQIAILVLTIFLILATGFNMFFDSYFVGWAVYISWFGNGLNIMISILLLVLVIRKLGKRYYTTPLILLYLSELICVLVFILFFTSSLFHYSKLIDIGILTPLIVIVHMIRNKLDDVNIDPMYTGGEQNQPMYYQQSQI